MPTGTVKIRQLCPLHKGKNSDPYPIEYYDEEGKRLDITGWDTVY